MGYDFPVSNEPNKRYVRVYLDKAAPINTLSEMHISTKPEVSFGNKHAFVTRAIKMIRCLVDSDGDDMLLPKISRSALIEPVCRGTGRR